MSRFLLIIYSSHKQSRLLSLKSFIHKHIYNHACKNKKEHEM